MTKIKATNDLSFKFHEILIRFTLITVKCEMKLLEPVKDVIAHGRPTRASSKKRIRLGVHC